MRLPDDYRVLAHQIIIFLSSYWISYSEIGDI